MGAVYDTIGRTYDRTRRADSRILDGVVDHLGLPSGARLLDVGCGSGNYTIALRTRGFSMVGVDISEHMLRSARSKVTDIQWDHGDACALSYPDGMFEGVVSILATHHISDLESAFAEMYRVLEPGGRVVLFTSSPQQMRAFWLNHYLPSVVVVSERAMRSYEDLEKDLYEAGFSNVRQAPFFVDDSLEDWFLHCGKYRPELYLDPVVRAGISTFALHERSDLLEQGLAQLAFDIESGQVDEVIRRYENDGGDFLFVAADKRL